MGTKTGFQIVGGASRDRTGDLLHAMQALSQLSYGPTRWKKGQKSFSLTNQGPVAEALTLLLGVPTGIRTPVATVKG